MTDQLAEQLYSQQKNYMYTCFEHYLKISPKSLVFLGNYAAASQIISS